MTESRTISKHLQTRYLGANSLSNQMNNSTLPKAMFLMKWLFPVSVLWSLVTAAFIPAYDNQLYYFISISALFFLVLNVLTAWGCGLYLSLQASQSLSPQKRVFNMVVAVLLNVWGQYHFRKVVKVAPQSKIGLIDVFYLFSLFIVLCVSYMMSVGVGDAS